MLDAEVPLTANFRFQVRIGNVLDKAGVANWVQGLNTSERTRGATEGREAIRQRAARIVSARRIHDVVGQNVRRVLRGQVVDTVGLVEVRDTEGATDNRILECLPCKTDTWLEISDTEVIVYAGSVAVGNRSTGEETPVDRRVVIEIARRGVFPTKTQVHRQFRGYTEVVLAIESQHVVLYVTVGVYAGSAGRAVFADTNAIGQAQEEVCFASASVGGAVASVHRTEVQFAGQTFNARIQVDVFVVEELCAEVDFMLSMGPGQRIAGFQFAVFELVCCRSAVTEREAAAKI